jgi:hypothetical protein
MSKGLGPMKARSAWAEVPGGWIRVAMPGQEEQRP